jgi:HSP20 family protein
VNNMTTTVARWREIMFPPFDRGSGLFPLLSPGIRVEQFTEDGRVLVRAELPGVDPKEVEVTVLNGLLKIHAERTEEKRDNAHSEFHYGRLVRTAMLPPGVVEDTGTASYTDGVLEIAFKMGEPTEPGRHIAVETPKSKVDKGRK